MNVLATPSTPATGTSIPGAARRGNVLVQDKVAIPGWVCDLESYRRWAHSEDYPQSGWVSFLAGDIYVDPDMETFLTHNQVKQAFNLAIGLVLMNKPSGRYVPDRMLFTNQEADVSTEPDGLYAHWETLKTGRLRLVPGQETDFTELEGTPDMILEIVSSSSVKKDTVTLPSLYARAKIPEYWLVDARSEPSSFQIFQLVNDHYQSIPHEVGWLKSSVFGCSFQLVREIDPLGQPQFVVKVKA